MSQDIGNPRTPRFGGFLVFEAWLISDVGVEGEVSEGLACCLVDDADVEVVDDQDDWRVFVGSADRDVVHSAGSS